MKLGNWEITFGPLWGIDYDSDNPTFSRRYDIWSLEMWNEITDEGFHIGITFSKKGVWLFSHHIPAYWWKEF